MHRSQQLTDSEAVRRLSRLPDDHVREAAARIVWWDSVDENHMPDTFKMCGFGERPEAMNYPTRKQLVDALAVIYDREFAEMRVMANYDRTLSTVDRQMFSKRKGVEL